ncbi:HAD family hydrolase [Anaerotalea alkaliphila]|uniref:Beta-phosphoglucomutase n=1 Tax=Anaerotalea alkaliphila TaxID=2662126 RepID=A0A7X5HW73_9FIRM|nr:HAD family phosphatase [Anaerotalea alkaliphila]NDL67738.1 HAD family phosphatase [Anaerotalea alkaliphila]
MIEGFIFDMDGVLIDTEDCHFNAWVDVMKGEGIPVTLETYLEKIQVQGRRRAVENLMANPSEETIARLSAAKEEAYLREVDRKKEVVFGDARLFLEKCRDMGIPMGVASSSSLAVRMLERTGLLEFFPVVVGGGDVKRQKPEPDIFLEAARRLGIHPEHCVVFEDAKSGIEAAHRAGMHVVAVDRLHLLDPSERFLRMVNTLDDLSLEQLLGV